MPQTPLTDGALITSARSNNAKRYLSPREASEYLGVGYSTLSIARMKGTGPKHIRWGNNIRYDINDLEEFMTERRVTPQPRPASAKRSVGRPRKVQHEEPVL